MLLKIKCPFCGNESLLEVDEDKLKLYNESTEKIQDIFPNMPAKDRELLISGICKKCQKDIFE